MPARRSATASPEPPRTRHRRAGRPDSAYPPDPHSAATPRSAAVPSPTPAALTGRVFAPIEPDTARPTRSNGTMPANPNSTGSDQTASPCNGAATEIAAAASTMASYTWLATPGRTASPRPANTHSAGPDSREDADTRIDRVAAAGFAVGSTREAAAPVRVGRNSIASPRRVTRRIGVHDTGSVGREAPDTGADRTAVAAGNTQVAVTSGWVGRNWFASPRRATRRAGTHGAGSVSREVPGTSADRVAAVGFAVGSTRMSVASGRVGCNWFACPRRAIRSLGVFSTAPVSCGAPGTRVDRVAAVGFAVGGTRVAVASGWVGRSWFACPRRATRRAGTHGAGSVSREAIATRADCVAAVGSTRVAVASGCVGRDWIVSPRRATRRVGVASTVPDGCGADTGSDGVSVVRAAMGSTVVAGLATDHDRIASPCRPRAGMCGLGTSGAGTDGGKAASAAVAGSIWVVGSVSKDSGRATSPRCGTRSSCVGAHSTGMASREWTVSPRCAGDGLVSESWLQSPRVSRFTVSGPATTAEAVVSPRGGASRSSAAKATVFGKSSAFDGIAVTSGRALTCRAVLPCGTAEVRALRSLGDVRLGSVGKRSIPGGTAMAGRRARCSWFTGRWTAQVGQVGAVRLTAPPHRAVLSRGAAVVRVLRGVGAVGLGVGKWSVAGGAAVTRGRARSSWATGCWTGEVGRAGAVRLTAPTRRVVLTCGAVLSRGAAVGRVLRGVGAVGVGWVGEWGVAGVAVVGGWVRSSWGTGRWSGGIGQVEVVGRAVLSGGTAVGRGSAGVGRGAVGLGWVGRRSSGVWGCLGGTKAAGGGVGAGQAAVSRGGGMGMRRYGGGRSGLVVSAGLVGMVGRGQ
ncbi:hypothetical protein GCM10010483_31260 [Actinokineospora diospyrosa]